MAFVDTNEYARVHAFIRRKHGRATKCQNPWCVSTNPRRYEWALQKGKGYSTDVNDYIQLCPSCHRLYDMTTKQRVKMARINKGRKRPDFVGSLHPKSKAIRAYDLNGVFIKSWESINLCSMELGVNRGNISLCAKGKLEKTGGYKFKYQDQ